MFTSGKKSCFWFSIGKILLLTNYIVMAGEKTKTEDSNLRVNLNFPSCAISGRAKYVGGLYVGPLRFLFPYFSST